MKNVDGRDLSIADVAGEKGTLVVFSCNHCPFVKAWEGRIAQIGNTYKGKAVGVIVINSNDPAEYAEDGFGEMQKRAKKLGFEFPYVVDATSDVARAFGATRTPEAFLFDKESKLVYHGAIDDNKKGDDVEKHYLRDALDAVIAGKEVPIKETKFVGCSIKFRPKS
jgi:thioredoxin-related protein